MTYFKQKHHTMNQVERKVVHNDSISMKRTFKISTSSFLTAMTVQEYYLPRWHALHTNRNTGIK